MLVLFLCTIVLGVLNRIISVHAISAWNLLQEELRGYVLGFAEGLRDDPLPELSDTWSAPELVGRMKSEFGLDLELLLDRQVPLEVFRETYRREWASWQEYETRLASQLIGSSLAYLGLSEEQLMKRACVGAGPEAQRSRVRSHARRVTRAIKLAVWCFTLSGICFLMAVSVGVLVLLGRP